MKLAIMQPYFFPYLGHFSLIDYVDQWVIFDSCQYKKKFWLTRNRILHPNDGWMYINLPVKSPSHTSKIHDVSIINNNLTKIKGQLTHYKKAPFYEQTITLIDCINKSVENIKGLSQFNALILKMLCEYLGINFKFAYSSNLDIDYPDNVKPGEWSWHICKKLNATEYINPVSGKDLFNKALYKENSINIKFLEYKNPIYRVCKDRFIPGLSIIDAMMWLDPNEILDHIKKNRILIE